MTWREQAGYVKVGVKWLNLLLNRDIEMKKFTWTGLIIPFHASQVLEHKD